MALQNGVRVNGFNSSEEKVPVWLRLMDSRVLVSVEGSVWLPLQFLILQFRPV